MDRDKQKKPIISLIMLCAAPLSAVCFLWYKLETYNLIVHNDAGFYVLVYCFFAFILSAIIWLRNRKKGRPVTATWLVAVLILFTVARVGVKIPLCTECERTTAEELGILVHWIEPYP